MLGDLYRHHPRMRACLKMFQCSYSACVCVCDVLGCRDAWLHSFVAQLRKRHDSPDTCEALRCRRTREHW